MQNLSAIIRISLSCVISACAVLFSLYNISANAPFSFISVAKTETAAVQQQVPASTLTTPSPPDEEPDKEMQPQDIVSSKIDTATLSQQAAEAAANSTVSGKIIERFISPYTAKNSYKNVYLKNNTDLTVDIKPLLEAKLGFTIEKNSQPQVLILHTHATESFIFHDLDYYTAADSSRTTDQNKNMIALGATVADALNAAGIKTIHDTTLHDHPSYNESYSRAADTICSYLEKYPSIKVVIDLHRDAIAADDTDKVKVTTEIDGKKAAQIMLVMGSQSGSVKNFPDWQENLKLALKLQQTAETMYPSLARAITLMPKNYNESLTKGSLLIEIGTDANTFDEALYSSQLLGNILVKLLG